MYRLIDDKKTESIYKIDENPSSETIERSWGRAQNNEFNDLPLFWHLLKELQVTIPNPELRMDENDEKGCLYDQTQTEQLKDISC